MHACWLLIAVLLPGCTSVTKVRGRHAATLSADDIRQIRRLAQESPHFGHTVFTFDTIRPDQVHVRTREYMESGSDGENFYVRRRDGRWMVDERYPRLFQPERIVVTH
jgi:hypothetical protein